MVRMTTLYVNECVVLVVVIHACCSQLNLATVLCKQSDGCVSFPTHTHGLFCRPTHLPFLSSL